LLHPAISWGTQNLVLVLWMPNGAVAAVCAARKCSSLRTSIRRYSSIAFEYFLQNARSRVPDHLGHKEIGDSCRAEAASKRPPVAQIVIQKYSSPAALSVLAQLLRISLSVGQASGNWERQMVRTPTPYFTQRRSSALHLADTGDDGLVAGSDEFASHPVSGSFRMCAHANAMASMSISSGL